MRPDLESTKKPGVCFVAPYCYPLFNAQHRTMFGGWEVRIAQIAKELAKRGNFRVCIIVADHAQPHIEVRDGVELISWKGKNFWGIHSFTSEVKGENPANRKAPPPAKAKKPLDLETDKKRDKILNYFYPKEGVFRKFTHPLKKLYKRIIPWQTRTVIRYFLIGVKEGVGHLNGASVHNLRESKSAFLYRLQLGIEIARDAIGNMADQPVFPEMVSIYKEVDADIFLAPGNNDISAQVAWFAKKHSRIFIMMAGSDIDFSPEIQTEPEGRDLYGIPYQLKSFTIQNAAAHIVQNEKQAQMARAFGCSPTLIPNPVDLNRLFPKPADPKDVLWVGNTEENVKRPSLMLEVVRLLPDISFTMIMTPVFRESFDRFVLASRSLPNLTLLSGVPYEEIEQYFAQAKLFINTSTFEGFPNTFLQAGKYGVPIVSLKVDPNRMISQHNCGLLCNDEFATLVESIRKMMTDEILYRKTSENILNYLRQYHDKDKIIPQYETVFQSVLKA